MQRSRRVMLITFALTVLLSLSAVLPVLAAPVAQVGIEDVGADTPAESAGLQDGDVILAVNGTYISGVDQLAGAIQPSRAMNSRSTCYAALSSSN